jgi:ribosomal protein L40E
LPRSKQMAAALDFLVWGSGHGFLGYRKAFGIPWVVWTLILGIFVIIAASIDQNLYYVTEEGFLSYGVGYNWGAAIALALIPYLIVGGLMIFDLMKKGVLGPVGPMGRFTGTAATTGAAVAAQPAPMRTQPAGMVCPSCGVPVTAADAFCPSCGARLQTASSPVAPMAAAPATPSGTKVCNNCGTANPVGYAFCKRCGNKLL